MSARTEIPTEAAAQALAIMVAANGHVDEREIQALDELDAFRRLGVSRQRFIDLARQCLDDFGGTLGERSWLSAHDMRYLNGVLDAVIGPELRLHVCRFAAAVITADGNIAPGERLVYDHALSRWQIGQVMVTQAILRDHKP